MTTKESATTTARAARLLVVDVLDDRRVVINAGSDQGVRDGASYFVYVLGKEVFDPETKESLGRLEVARGYATVIHVQERLATLECCEREQATGGLLAMFAFGRPVTRLGPPRFYDVAVGDLVRRA